MALESTWSNLRNRVINNPFRRYKVPNGTFNTKTYEIVRISPELQKHWNNTINPGVSSLGNSSFRTYPRYSRPIPSSLDIENSTPNGGPLHAPQYGFSHLYLPSLKYTSQNSVTIENRLEQSNLDTQVPISVPSAGFTHTYTSDKKFVDDTKGQKNKGYLLYKAFDRSNLDLQAGNPINDPSSGFVHSYTPFSKFSASTYGQKQKGRLKTAVFGITNLDLENPNPVGGPLNAPLYGFAHTYLPTNTFSSTPNGQKSTGYLKSNAFNLSNLDLEVGIPQNAPAYGFSHTYLPTNTFFSTPNGQKSIGYLKLNAFSTSGLDLEVGNPINDPSSGFVHKYTPFSIFSASTYGQKQNGRLKTTFGLTNLDLEDPLQTGGPLNAPLYGFAHTYLPNNQFSNTTEGAIRGNGKIQSSVFQTTALDLESNQAGTQQGGVGGPINDPVSQFVQTYTPQNPYTQTQAGVLRGLGKLYDTFKVTALDVENRKAGAAQGGIGGPNRTSFDYPSGLYDNISTYSGKIISQGIIQEWTPKRTYIDFMRRVQRPAFPG